MKTKIGVFIGGMVALLALYASTFQTIPNGSSYYFMIDVGETQIVLNEWGTLHATGYPLYVITGSLLTDGFTALGIDPATAPALVSLVWGIPALAVIYVLGVRLTGRILPALAVTLLYGLTRSVWIHFVIAEIYTFGLLIMVGLLAVALWRREVDSPARLYVLALLGGLGVAHHRAIAMMIPALLFATWRDWLTPPPESPSPSHKEGGDNGAQSILSLDKNTKTSNRINAQMIRRGAGIVVVCFALGLLGFAQYLYLPFQAQAGADWVYGDPSTLNGFLDQFLGREANRFIGTPETPAALWDNINMVNMVLIRDLTLPGLIVGVIGLVVAIFSTRQRRAGIVLALNAICAYAFHIFFYTDILSALILPVTLSLAFGWLLLVDVVLARLPQTLTTGQTGFVPIAVITGLALIFGGVLVALNHEFIDDLTGDTTGLETIEQVRPLPDDSTLMIAWGPRHFAVGFAQDVRGEFETLTLLDHNALLEPGVITPEYTFFSQPPDWWLTRLGAPLILRAVAPGMVQVDTTPRTPESPVPGDDPIRVAAESLTCTDDTAILDIDWYAAETPERDLSVFVHLVDSAGTVIGQDDQSAPVYGWRPLTTWTAGEIVRDIYTLPRHPQESRIRYGLYYQDTDGAFVNMYEFESEACGE